LTAQRPAIEAAPRRYTAIETARAPFTRTPRPPKGAAQSRAEFEAAITHRPGNSWPSLPL
jgi:hypothetical protein